VVEAWFREVVSGSRTGLTAATARAVFAAASVPYAVVVSARNWCYDRGWFRQHAADVPVVSVGNLTTGGTGKTPVVALVVEWFRRRGLRPGILSRGYRRHSESANDEKLVLERLCPDVPHVQNADRVQGAARAVRLGCNVLVLDDGFQHRRLRRDLDVVLVDATNPWGFGRLLPRGLLREPRRSLRRAQVVCLTRVELVDAGRLCRLRDEVTAAAPGALLAEVAFQPTGLLDGRGNRTPLDNLRGQPVVAFCGIGNPDAFRATLLDCGVQLGKLFAFPDHHHYSADDLQQVQRAACDCGAAAVVTTLKDLVKVDRLWTDDRPLRALLVEPVLVRGREEFERRLSEVAELGASR